MDNRINFEMGANKTHYHSMNVNFGKDLPKPKIFYDFKLAEKGDAYPETGEEYVVFKAAEVGNIFPLGTRFADDFDYTYTDQQEKRKKIYMGCYGIGHSRIMGVLVEKFSDADIIGIPHRLGVSRRTGDKVEYKKRSSKEAKLVNLDEIQ